MSILHKIKNGKKNHKEVNFPGTEEKVAIVILSSDTTMNCKIKADDFVAKHKIEDDMYKDTVLQQHLAYEFLRDCSNLQNQLATSFDDFIQNIDNVELTYFIFEYNNFIQENSPFLNAVNEEQFELLKKTLVKMTLKDLSGESLLSLRNFLMSLA